MERRLAAILVADVVGYTGLMERDETGTLTRLEQLRDKVVNPSIQRFGGRLGETRRRWHGRRIRQFGEGGRLRSGNPATTCCRRRKRHWS